MGCPSLELGLLDQSFHADHTPLHASCFTCVIADRAEDYHLADKLAQRRKMTCQRQDSHQISLPVKSLLCPLYTLSPLHHPVPNPSLFILCGAAESRPSNVLGDNASKIKMTWGPFGNNKKYFSGNL